jgi:hypothetical protein
VAPFKPHLSRRLDSFKERQVETAVDDENAEGQTQDRGPDVTYAVTLLDLENCEAGEWKRRDCFQNKSKFTTVDQFMKHMNITTKYY